MLGNHGADLALGLLMQEIDETAVVAGAVNLIEELEDEISLRAQVRRCVDETADLMLIVVVDLTVTIACPLDERVDVVEGHSYVADQLDLEFKVFGDVDAGLTLVAGLGFALLPAPVTDLQVSGDESARSYSSSGLSLSKASKDFTTLW